jgi:hypothetical protein
MWEDSKEFGVGLKMEVVCSSQTLISTYKFTRHYYPEDKHQLLLEKLIVTQLAKKFIVFYGTILLITVFTRPRHLFTLKMR